jgi:hypothetical protein
MIRWISNSRVSLQRLGFCKFAVLVADRSRTRKELADAVLPSFEQKPLMVAEEKEFAKWVNSRPKHRETAEEGRQVAKAAQDTWVFNHAARTGWLSEGAFAEYYEEINLPFLLDLINEECLRTDMGELLLNMQSTAGPNSKPMAGKNPLVLSDEERAVFFYALVKEDGDFLIPFMNTLLCTFGDSSFSYVEAGNVIPHVFEETLNRFQGALYTSADRDQYQSMEEAKQKIVENMRKEIHVEGFGSRREQTAVPRLEWLVDLGVLGKLDGERYKYFVCSKQKTPIEMAYARYISAAGSGYADGAIGKLLDNEIMLLVFRFLCDHSCETEAVTDILGFVKVAYERLKPPTGYCVMRPLLLLSHNLNWAAAGKQVVEYRQAVELLEEAYRRDSASFYFTTARFGEDYQIKFDSRP